MKYILLAISLSLTIGLITFLAFDYYKVMQAMETLSTSPGSTVFEKLNILGIEQSHTKCFVIMVVGLFLSFVGINLIYQTIESTKLSGEAKGVKFDLQSNSPGLIIITLGCLLLISTLVFRSYLHLEVNEEYMGKKARLNSDSYNSGTN